MVRQQWNDVSWFLSLQSVSCTEGDEVGSPSAELARSEGALVGCRETTRGVTGTGSGRLTQ